MSGKRLVLWLQLLACACTSTSAIPPAPLTDAPIKKYIVRLEGRNYLFADGGGRPQRFGFATTRNVEARSADEAEQLAIREIQTDEELNASLLNDASDPPQVTATQHVEVESFEAVRIPELGYIFFEDHDTR